MCYNTAVRNKGAYQIMKNINLFKYKDTSEFWAFLSSYGYKLEDIKGFSLAGRKQCHGNVLKIYDVYFKDGEYEYFKVISFKDSNEYRQALLGFGCGKLLRWYEDAELTEIKENL